MKMKVSEICLSKIKDFEGFSATAYRCPAGVLTIGYGHTQNVAPGMTITEDAACSLLLQDLRPCEDEVNSLCPLTQGQFDALCSLAFNIGLGNFRKSTLREMVASNRFDRQIASEFMKWKFSGKKVLAGLVARRKWEARRYYE